MQRWRVKAGEIDLNASSHSLNVGQTFFPGLCLLLKMRDKHLETTHWLSWLLFLLLPSLSKCLFVLRILNKYACELTCQLSFRFQPRRGHEQNARPDRRRSESKKYYLLPQKRFHGLRSRLAIFTRPRKKFCDPNLISRYLKSGSIVWSETFSYFSFRRFSRSANRFFAF